nr:MAG TPA: hypothetical protein [Caudoviricetes sp.]DAE61625.1 MAG TPA: hypothetical protein [Caudoviricetes sp.]DAL98768.1 MAG TPA: hypothetical protein [Caudoviricetes sp.]
MRHRILRRLRRFSFILQFHKELLQKPVKGF